MSVIESFILALTGHLCWGKKSGPPIALVTQPPLACQLSKDKEIDLFSYQFILKTGLRIEQMNDKADVLIYPYQEVSQKLG